MQLTATTFALLTKIELNLAPCFNNRIVETSFAACHDKATLLSHQIIFLLCLDVGCGEWVTVKGFFNCVSYLLLCYSHQIIKKKVGGKHNFVFSEEEGFKGRIFFRNLDSNV